MDELWKQHGQKCTLSDARALLAHILPRGFARVLNVRFVTLNGVRFGFDERSARTPLNYAVCHAQDGGNNLARALLELPAEFGLQIDQKEREASTWYPMLYRSLDSCHADVVSALISKSNRALIDPFKADFLREAAHSCLFSSQSTNDAVVKLTNLELILCHFHEDGSGIENINQTCRQIELAFEQFETLSPPQRNSMACFKPLLPKVWKAFTASMDRNFDHYAVLIPLPATFLNVIKNYVLPSLP